MKRHVQNSLVAIIALAIVILMAPEQGGKPEVPVVAHLSMMDLKMDPNDPDVLYASSWDRVRNNTASVAYGTNSKIWKTTDAGATWLPMGNGLPAGPMSRINLALDPTTNPAGIFAAFVDTSYNVQGFYQSTNAGANWANVSAGLPSRYVSDVQASPLVESVALVTFSGYKDNEFTPHIFRTRDYGNTWTDVARDLPQLALNAVQFHPSIDGLWVVASDGGVCNGKCGRTLGAGGEQYAHRSGV